MEVSAETEAIFVTAGFRCCSLEDFAGWRERALECNPPNAAHYPGSARQFCYDCLPMVRKFMAEQGLCVREDKK